MIGKWLKNRFGSQAETPETEQFYSPLRIGLHSTITVSTVDLLGLQEQFNPKFKLPEGSLDVVAISTIDNDPDEFFRIYAVDINETPYILQLNLSYDPRSGKKDISEVLFLQQISEYEPLTQKEWDRFREETGAEAFTVNNLTYERIWGEEVDGVIDLFTFEEDSVALDGKTKYTTHQMLFGRQLKGFDSEVTEFVLVGVEETEDRDTIVTQVGFAVPPQAVHIQ